MTRQSLIKWEKGAPGYPCALGRILTESGEELAVVELDFDAPGVARTFGWDMTGVQVQGAGYYGLAACDHGGTDGTLDCEGCGLTAGAFIGAACQFLSAVDGATAINPGY